MSDLIESAAAMWTDAPALATVAMIALKASLILLVTAVAALSLRRLSAAKRHIMWGAGIGAALVIPFAALSLPTWRIPVRYAAVASAAAPVMPAVSRAASLGTELRVAGATNDPAPSPAVNRTTPTRNASQRQGSQVSRQGDKFTLADTLFWVWLAGAVLALWPWIAGVIGRSRLAAAASDLLPATWERSLRRLRAEGKVPRRVRVLAAAQCTTPMTWGVLRPIVLVPACSEWQEDERRNALLHEFAHVRRADYLCKLASRILCSIHWFNPLVWLAARGERLAREQACDDAVLRAGSRPSSYAQQLLEVAQGRSRYVMAAAALTMARRSNLSRRLRAILDAGHDRSPTGRGFSSLAVGTMCLVVPPLAALTPEWVKETASPNEKAALHVPDRTVRQDSGPAGARAAVHAPSVPADSVLPRTPIVPQQATACAPTSGKRSTTSLQSNSDGGGPERRRWHVKWIDGVCRIELDGRGVFTLTPNADDVAAISSGGYFELEQDDGRIERRVRIARGSGGALERTYWVAGSRRAWDADAAKWLGEAILTLDRRTAFAVDMRLPMLLQRGGVEAVMAEVAQMPAAYPQRIYYTKLFERETLTAQQLVRVLETAARSFDSGYEKAELLLRVAKQPSFAEPVHLAFAQMARSIESDYEKRRALSALLARSDLKQEIVRTMLEATEGMKSDYELAELLLAIDRRYAADETTRPFYVRAVSTIRSDYEQRRVLTAIMRAGELGPAATADVIAIAGRSMKGYELAEFLVQIANRGTLDQSTSSAFFDAASNVGSDYERRRVLETLLKKGALTPAVVEGILATAATIAGDYDCAELLVAVSRTVKIDASLRPAYDKAAATIGSDYEYGRVMSAARRSALSSGQQ